MTAYRVDIETHDPDSFSKWIRENIPSSVLVRSVGYPVRKKGWYFKNVFSDRDVAQDFHRHWYPEESHDVQPWGDPPTR